MSFDNVAYLALQFHLDYEIEFQYIIYAVILKHLGLGVDLGRCKSLQLRL